MRPPSLLLALVACTFAIAATARAEGSFAYSQFGNGGWASGVAFDSPSKAQADQQALMNCSNRGPGCSIKWRFNQSCFAYAVQAMGNGYGVGQSPDVSTAQQLALNSCNKYGMACTIRGSYCDTISEEQEKEKFAAFQANWQRCFRGNTTDDELQSGGSACDDALNYDRILPVDRNKVVARKNVIDGVVRARAQQKQNEEAQQETYRGDCLAYNVKACWSALHSPLTPATDRAWLQERWMVAARYGLMTQFCKDGSAVSCDFAKASPAATDAAKASLDKIREGLPIYQKAWAAVFVYLPASVQQSAMTVRAGTPSASNFSFERIVGDVPTSTLVAGLVAAVLGLGLAGVLVKQKAASRSVAIAQASAPAAVAPPPQIQSVVAPPPPIESAITAQPQIPISPAQAVAQDVQPTIVPPQQGERKVNGSPTPSTAYVLNILLPGAGNIYFGQPVIGSLFVLSILFGMFMFMFGASAAVLGIVIILASVVAAFFTLGLSLVFGLPVGLLFLLMGAGPILAFLIWIFALVVGELLIHSKVKKAAIQAGAAQSAG